MLLQFCVCTLVTNDFLLAIVTKQFSLNTHFINHQKLHFNLLIFQCQSSENGFKFDFNSYFLYS